MLVDYAVAGQSKYNFPLEDIHRGFFKITNSEIIFLARRSKHDPSRYKLVKYDMTTGTTGKNCHHKIFELVSLKFQ